MPYDFTDEPVYSLVKGTHLPTELKVVEPVRLDGQLAVVDGTPAQLKLVCTVDHEPWPCTAVTELRAFDEKKKQAQQSGEEIIKRRIAEGRILG